MSLGQILREGMEARFARHRRMAQAFRAGWKALGLKLLPVNESVAANTLSALYYPEGVDVAMLGRAREQGVVLAGGPHPQLKTRYFRVGHMNVVGPGDVLATVGAVERALAAAGHKGPAGCWRGRRPQAELLAARWNRGRSGGVAWAG